MPKMKTNRSAAKRFTTTGTGKVKRFRGGKSHTNIKKNSKRMSLNTVPATRRRRWPMHRRTRSKYWVKQSPIASIVHVDGETIFFTTYSGGLDQRKRADLTLVDMSRRFQVGDSVYGEPSGGLSMHYQKGRVVSVDTNHTRYEVKTKDGKMFVSNFKTIVAAP